MARPVKEWIGDTDEQRAPPRVRLRVFDREGGKCHICRQPIAGKKWALDHVTALINGGENRESNLKPVHIACHAEKTRADVAEKAKVAAKRKAHLRIVDAPPMQGQPFQKTRKAARREQAAATKLPIPAKRKRPMFAKEANDV